jgi:hypothetical protein
LLVVLALAMVSCADIPMEVRGMPGVTVRVDREPDPPIVHPDWVSNPYDHIITVYYADGRMQHIMPGEVVQVRDVTYHVQVSNPNPRRR